MSSGYLHGVRELERLEVSVREDGCACAKVLDLSEPGHELGPGNTTLLVYQLDGGSFSVVGHTVADQHVKLAVVVLDGKNHCHRLTYLH